MARVLGDDVRVVKHGGEAAVYDLGRHRHVAENEAHAVVLALHALAPHLPNVRQGAHCVGLLVHYLVRYFLRSAQLDEDLAGHGPNDAPVALDVCLAGVGGGDRKADDVFPLDGGWHGVELP